MRRLLSAALMAAALVVGACGSEATTQAPTPTATATATSAPAATAPASGGLVGIAMPTRSSSRWIDDGDTLVESLTALGYETSLQYAGDDVATQVSQIEGLIDKGAKVLVIAAIDGSTLADVLQRAADQGIWILAYDRLIRGSANVDYYTTFDSFQVGILQATSIERSLDLKHASGPFNLELFAGPPDDDLAGRFFNGAMSILQPYITAGKLIVQSGETQFPGQVGTLRWDGETARVRLDTILANDYADKRIDAILSPYDGISRGIIASLKQVGYYATDLPGPIVTGQGAELLSVKSILAGEQTSTVFKDSRVLAAQAARMVDQMLTGETVDANDTTTNKNGVKTVPSFLLETTLVTRDNVQAELVDSGYYAAEDVRP
jgi:putative multiple sugar transport system substrate-binding protein